MAILVANAPISWGIHQATDVKYPYTEVLNQIADTGYVGVELGPWGYFPTEADKLQAELSQRRLRLASGSVPVDLLQPDAAAQSELAVMQVAGLLAALGAQHVILMEDHTHYPELLAQAGRVRNPRLSEAEWDTFAQRLNHIGKRVFEELGLKIAFHHHCGTHIESAREVESLMQRAAPDLVGLCLDTGHWHYAGGDAIDALKLYGKRIWYLHFTDCEPNIRQFALEERLDLYEATQAGVFSDLGQGSVDFPRIFTMLRRIGYDGWAVVEQDTLLNEPDADRQSARYNRDYLRRIGI